MNYCKPEVRLVGSAIATVQQQTTNATKGDYLHVDVISPFTPNQPVTAAAYEADE